MTAALFVKQYSCKEKVIPYFFEPFKPSASDIRSSVCRKRGCRGRSPEYPFPSPAALSFPEQKNPISASARERRRSCVPAPEGRWRPRARPGRWHTACSPEPRAPGIPECRADLRCRCGGSGRKYSAWSRFYPVENASHLLRGGGKQAGQDHLVEIGEKFREIPVNVGGNAPFELSLFSPGERAADTGRAGDAAF